ncbi:nitronate monooxygenase [candidate division WOR-3 bacterium]|nr:nitronate monooxygenase [candidate division WOR-3 bacterium]
MRFKKIPKLRIGDLRPKLPIIQGGMSVGISLSGLASAVAKAGAVGVIGTAGIGMLEPDFHTNFRVANRRALRKEIRKTRDLTDGIIGVNIMVALSDFDDMVQIAVDEGVDLVFIGAGLPLAAPEKLQDRSTTTRLIPIVSSARAAKVIFQYWRRHYNYIPDAVVVEGSLAGGHLGFKREQIEDPAYALEKILSQVISITRVYKERFNKDIPVIAAGGIYTGADIHRFLQLGAKGVQMATRFTATYECDGDMKFKEMYLKCKKEDVIIIDSPVGLPGRAVQNRFLKDVQAGAKKPFKCPWLCLKTCDFRNAPYCIALALTNAKKGNLEDGFAFAGANAYRLDKIVSVRELIETLLEEYEKAVEKG